MTEVGIDDIAIHFPKLYFGMEDFAEFRGADFGKLNRGLGLEAMAIPDGMKILQLWVQMPVHD